MVDEREQAAPATLTLSVMLSAIESFHKHPLRERGGVLRPEDSRADAPANISKQLEALRDRF
jgi:hypothetical protein